MDAGMQWLMGLPAEIYGHLSALSLGASFFLALALVLHWKSPRTILRRLLPSSLGFNLTAYLVDALFIASGVVAAVALGQSLLLPWSPLSPASWAGVPAVLVGLAAVFIGDFVGYWRHRLEHTALLWSSHVMHHSDEDMTWLTLFRFHPINRLTTSMIDTLALVALGLPVWAVVLNQAVRHYYGMWIHASLPWTYGPMGRIFVSPAMHKWHHVAEGSGVGTNFATVFSVFDKTFRTYYVPGPCNQPTGVPDVPASYAGQLLLPLTALGRYLRPNRAAPPQEVQRTTIRPEPPAQPEPSGAAPPSA